MKKILIFFETPHPLYNDMIIYCPNYMLTFNLASPLQSVVLP